jgi:hypothetical protein
MRFPLGSSQRRRGGLKLAAHREEKGGELGFRGGVEEGIRRERGAGGARGGGRGGPRPHAMCVTAPGEDDNTRMSLSSKR